MLVIRLSRIGHENLQKFRLVEQEKTSSPKSGKVIAIVGHYNPADPENKLVFDSEKIETFLKNGATPSDTVARLLLKNGFKKELIEKFVEKYTKQKSKKASTEEKQEKAPTEKKVTDEPKAEEKQGETPTEEKKEETPAEEKVTDEPKAETESEEKK
jgi:small subunit ribosomal protein S16